MFDDQRLVIFLGLLFLPLDKIDLSTSKQINASGFLYVFCEWYTRKVGGLSLSFFPPPYAPLELVSFLLLLS